MLRDQPGRRYGRTGRVQRGATENVLRRIRKANSMNDYYAVRARARNNSAGASATGFLEKLDPALAERLQFLSAFLREPARVGSFVPSSPALAQTMLDGCDRSEERRVGKECRSRWSPY